MAITVVVSLSKINETRDQALILVESDAADSAVAFDELRSPGAKNLALQYAAVSGVQNPRIMDTGFPYPVNSEGTKISKIIETYQAEGKLPDSADPKVRPHRYHNTVTVGRSQF